MSAMSTRDTTWCDVSAAPERSVCFGKQIFVSNTLHEDYVGLEEVDDGVYDLFYCFYHIGRYELKTNKIHDMVSRVGLSVRRVDRVSRVSTMSPE